MKRAINLRANGKLLITGEYLVMAGAKALALPLCFGQTMTLQKIINPVIDWVSSSPAGHWFNAKFETHTLKIIECSSRKIAGDLKKLLTAARKLNPEYLTGQAGWRVRIVADYPLEWGLGSSATLCYLIAGWAGVPVFDLSRLISTGSGYDVACAGRNSLLYYQLQKGQPEVTDTRPGKALRENTYFVYLGKKQDSKKEVAAFLEKANYSEIDLVAVSHLSTEICRSDSPEEMIRLVNEHEYILSTILKKDPLGKRFSSFPGTVKSLGAWGGDFAMFISSDDPKDVVRILHQMEFSKVFRYSDLEIKA